MVGHVGGCELERERDGRGGRVDGGMVVWRVSCDKRHLIQNTCTKSHAQNHMIQGSICTLYYTILSPPTHRGAPAQVGPSPRPASCWE